MDNNLFSMYKSNVLTGGKFLTIIVNGTFTIAKLKTNPKSSNLQRIKWSHRDFNFFYFFYFDTERHFKNLIGSFWVSHALRRLPLGKVSLSQNFYKFCFRIKKILPPPDHEKNAKITYRVPVRCHHPYRWHVYGPYFRSPQPWRWWTKMILQPWCTVFCNF